jgi:CHAD domain-containing protein
VSTRSRPTTERLHEWRKQAKYLRHALEILSPIAPKEIDALARHAHRLADGLGEDHDLAVLRERAARETRIDAATREAILARIDRRRRTLQRRALTLGSVVYREPSRMLERRLARRWNEWRSGRTHVKAGRPQ